MKVFHNAGVEVDTANDNTTTTYAIGLPPFGDEHCVVSDPKNPQPIVYGADGSDDDITTNIYSETYERTAQTVWHVQTGGKAIPRRQNLWRFTGSAWKIADKRAVPPFAGAAMQEITNKTQIVLKDLGNLKADGNLWLTLPDDVEKDITPQVANLPFYTFSVGGRKYLSHFEVFVDQPWPNYPNDNFDPIYNPQPAGYPYYRIGVNGGHAWWKLTTDAPTDAVNKFIASASFISSNCVQFLGVEVGYGETNGLDWLNTILTGYAPTSPGELPWPNTHTATVHRIYAIGFPNLISGLSYTENLHDYPGTYDLKHNNCATETGQAGWASGVPLPNDWLPEVFGFNLPPSDP
ncbi:MAG: hypothetical protein WCK57_06660 [Verrucomicrobiae bacterium]